jgi:Fe2+ transport system protein FeoA
MKIAMKGVRMSDAPMHVALTILDVAPGHHERATRLAAMGLVIGSHVIVRQKKPAVIVEYDATVLALDHEVAREVIVEVDDADRVDETTAQR